MTIKKAHLIDSIYNQANYSRTNSAKLKKSLMEIIKTTLENGEDVLISGFGKFCVMESVNGESGSLQPLKICLEQGGSLRSGARLCAGRGQTGKGEVLSYLTRK